MPTHKTPPATRHPRQNHGFTLIELLIVVAIMAILSTMVISNFTNSLKQARDSKRKQDLNKLARVMEDYYNDHQHYPPPDMMGGMIGAAWGTKFFNYPFDLPKDPSSPSFNYYYMSDPQSYNFYAIFARLEITNDPDIAATGCIGGCGPNSAYNYSIHSPNIVFQNGNPNKSLGAFPTQPPIPPPTVAPGSTCSFDSCGSCPYCGGPDVGVSCQTRSRCWYDGSNFLCKFDPSCNN
ncbi:type II secretion system GspH family protein [Patescibacteria group bacterium]|nr:type II secretion system GspH family protein [Patescibacteria group bacterium]